MCQEVIELMQRYLDQDLDETEYRRMLLHVQGCAACSELFERLVNLSQELESLPKVTPPVSLVDSIMPRLQLIDAGEASGAVEAAEPAKRRHIPAWRQRMREWVSLPVAGGVVAAGLVLGFFVFSQQQLSSNDQKAEVLLSISAGSADKAASTSSSAKPEVNGAAPQASTVAPMAQGAAPAAANDVKSDAPQSKQVPTMQDEAPKDKAPAAPPQSEKINPSNAAPAPTPSPKQEEPEAAADAKATETAPGDSMALKKQVVPPDGSQEPVQSPAATAAPEPERTLMGKMGSPGTESAPEGSMGNFRQTPGEQYGIAALPPMASFAPPSVQDQSGMKESTSAGNEYTASLNAEGHVVIRDNAQQKAVFTSSYQWKPEQVTLIGWSPELVFTYEVKVSEQTKETYAIRVKELKEEKLKDPIK
ncbi:zf-HC2 domain-containing protein [Paenibacillus sp. GD4]|uniref:anti-sigma factor family protein n=1 Tax=Paenibacillus sp. GD4 TaxID=3068890 RepID=UPI002796BFD3|nr:anti-sigma factor [Paenibacillus sp. GD4]MDQ1912883.1 zf-HC2 domain-containing protein [Paenibacillus sp. GD4]